MSNAHFDRLDAQVELQRARESLGEWGRALVRTDIDDDALPFLARLFWSAQDRVLIARYNVRHFLTPTAWSGKPLTAEQRARIEQATR